MIEAATADTSTWRVGVLFSRSGPLKITQSEHFLGTELAIRQINEAGGILGRQLEVVAYDPASNPDEFRHLANRLLTDDGISVIFGCSSSAERKAVLPAIERRNGLLWYPSPYEGFEYSPNVIYTGACPNQNSFPLAEYLVRHVGPRLFLVGSDYVYPRESNRVMRDLVESYNGTVVDEVYVPMEASDAELRRVLTRLNRHQPDAVFSTVVGSAARRFYRMYYGAGFDTARTPIASLTMAEGEIAAIGPEACVGHITSAGYFGSLDSDANRKFVADYRAAFSADSPVSIYSASAYAQVMLFAAALKVAGALDTQLLVEAAQDLTVAAPEGPITINGENNHCWLRPRIGRVREDGEFDIVWQAAAPVKPDPYFAVSPFGASWIGHPEAVE